LNKEEAGGREGERGGREGRKEVGRERRREETLQEKLTLLAIDKNGGEKKSPM
jgi:hypothetical protein